MFVTPGPDWYSPVRVAGVSVQGRPVAASGVTKSQKARRRRGIFPGWEGGGGGRREGVGLGLFFHSGIPPRCFGVASITFENAQSFGPGQGRMEGGDINR